MSVDMAARLAKVRRETVRWLMLVALQVARPQGMSAGTLRAVLAAEYADATELEVQRELDYLRDRDLVSIDIDPMGQWYAKIDRAGTDVVQYTVDVEPGIARPAHGA